MAVKIDYDSTPRSFRDYLEQMVKEGEYLAIDDEVDWDLEVGAICRHADETMSPSPIFNKVKDSPGFRSAEWGFTKSGTRNHPEKGVWYFADSPYFGVGTEAYHSLEDYFGRVTVPGQEDMEIVSGSGIGIYSCIGLEEHTGKPKPHILTFKRAWPKAIQDKVVANWERWGFRTPDPVLQKHASQSTPWVYFTKSGEGETGRGHD